MSQYLIYASDCLILGSLLLFGTGALLIVQLWFGKPTRDDRP